MEGGIIRRIVGKVEDRWEKEKGDKRKKKTENTKKKLKEEIEGQGTVEKRGVGG